MKIWHDEPCAKLRCPLCKTELENSEHLLWTCDILQDIWNALMVQVPLFESSLDHKELFLRAFLEADDRHKKIIAISLWSL